MTLKLPKGTRIFIRREKARIRREFSDKKEQEGLINGLFVKFFHDDKRNLQPGSPKGN